MSVSLLVFSHSANSPGLSTEALDRKATPRAAVVPRPDQAQALAILVIEEVGVDRMREARTFQLQVQIAPDHRSSALTRQRRSSPGQPQSGPRVHSRRLPKARKRCARSWLAHLRCGDLSGVLAPGLLDGAEADHLVGRQMVLSLPQRRHLIAGERRARHEGLYVPL